MSKLAPILIKKMYHKIQKKPSQNHHSREKGLTLKKEKKIGPTVNSGAYKKKLQAVEEVSTLFGCKRQEKKNIKNFSFQSFLQYTCSRKMKQERKTCSGLGFPTMAVTTHNLRVESHKTNVSLNFQHCCFLFWNHSKLTIIWIRHIGIATDKKS